VDAAVSVEERREAKASTLVDRERAVARAKGERFMVAFL
jgi:hypothetical protein